MVGALMDRVVGLGELLIRMSPPAGRLIVQARSLDMEVGGAEANVLCGLAALGHGCAMVSRVADNALGRLAVATLHARGVSTAHVTHAPGRMGLYFYESGRGPRAPAITYDRTDSAFARSSAADFDFVSALQGAKLLHLSGITPALNAQTSALALAAARRARALGVSVSIDGNYRAQLWDAWDSNPKAALSELFAEADILFGNHRDIALVTGQDFSGHGLERRREASDAAFAAFPNLKLVASTARRIINSDHHCIAARVDTRADHAQTDEFSVTDIMDRIGTGDAFAAGVLHQYLKGGSGADMAETGLALCVLKHGLPGDMSLFGETDISAFWSETRDVRR